MLANICLFPPHSGVCCYKTNQNVTGPDLSGYHQFPSLEWNVNQIANSIISDSQISPVLEKGGVSFTHGMEEWTSAHLGSNLQTNTMSLYLLP